MSLPDLLPIIPFTAPVRGEVTPPGSKSLTNRALLLAALCPEPVRLTGALFSDDTGDQANGMLLSVAPSGPAGETDGHDVLAVVQTSSHDHSQVHLGSANGTTLQFRALPYALPE